MLKAIKFAFLLVALVYGSQVSGETLECNFVPNTNLYPEKLSYCRVNDNEIFDGSRLTIDDVEVNDLGDKTIDDVQALNLGFVALNYFPKDLQKFFKNIKGIKFALCNLYEIKQSDLEPFPQLKYLYLWGNQITTLEANVFKFNPELKIIDLYENEITHIDPAAFDGLNNLENLRLDNNKCKKDLGRSRERSEVLETITRIKNGDC